MRAIARKLTGFVRDESGVTAIEYALLAALIAVVIIAGAALLGTNINELFNDIANCMANPAAGCMGGGEVPPA